MKNITLVRIDDRLIHGQVMTQWVKSRYFNTILIVDDAIAKDDFLKSIAVMAVPSEFKGLVMKVDEAVDYLESEANNESILVLVKFVSTIEQLIHQGISIPELNVGGIGMKPGRKKIYRNIAISDTEKETFLRLISNGTKVTVQIVPSDPVIEIEKLF
ncbi:PTS system mannose/fructose/N-acetylgalactosamine-transporter subunit IIB [Traorella massiliensis]|uniref:PTS system mannose/fructose/N-acetylgalactosamine-transporter subunit IIB n=1 Tax=Traorella massiliensis TaxID=1903263 RepID=UPI0023527A02|nr:PTS sugar transporter subunit IIB [Traorella massiliensis]